MEFLADTMYADRRLTRIEATFVLPAAQLAATSHDEVSAAIRRYTAAKIEESDIHVRADITRGRRAMLPGGHDPALDRSRVRADDRQRLRRRNRHRRPVDRCLGDALVPDRQAVLGAWTHRSDRLICERLRDMHFTLKPE
jgi:hypothetical protein